MRAAESPACVHALLVERIPENLLKSGQVSTGRSDNMHDKYQKKGAI